MFSSFSIATGVLPGKQEPRERYRDSGRLYLVRGREAERRKMADFDSLGRHEHLATSAGISYICLLRLRSFA